MSQQAQTSELKFKEEKTAKVTGYFSKTLFNEPQHVLLQDQDAITYQLCQKNIPVCAIHFIIKEQIAYSPWRSLFGGFEIAKKITPNDLDAFYDKIEKSLKRKKVKKISIVLHPNFFRKGRYKLVKEVLEKNGFRKVVKYKNHHIEILGKSLQPFLHNMERRKLKKANKEGLEFYIESIEMLSIIYQFISVCRKEKEQPLNISFEKLRESIQMFPERYFIFTVKKSNEIYAATIGVKVNDNVLYNFLPASPSKFNAISPMVKLIDGLYNYAKKHHYFFIDLGVSTTSEGKHQDSLVKFKKHIGGQRSTKLKMEKLL